MRFLMIAALVLALSLSGCGKKGNTASQSPGQAPAGSSGTAGQTSPGSTAGTGGTAGGAAPAAGGNTSAGGSTSAGGGKQPANNGAAAPSNTPQQLPVITREQFDKIDVKTTYDALTKLVGAPGKLISENGDAKTYQFQLKDNPKYRANVVFKKGVYSEKSIFMV